MSVIFFLVKSSFESFRFGSRIAYFVVNIRNERDCILGVLFSSLDGRCGNDEKFVLRVDVYDGVWDVLSFK